MFFASGYKKPQYLQVFLVVFTRHCTLQYFGSALRVRGGGTEMTSNLLNNQVMGLASLRKAKLKVPPLDLPVVISS